MWVCMHAHKYLLNSIVSTRDLVGVACPDDDTPISSLTEMGCPGTCSTGPNTSTALRSDTLRLQTLVIEGSDRVPIMGAWPDTSQEGCRCIPGSVISTRELLVLAGRLLDTFSSSHTLSGDHLTKPLSAATGSSCYTHTHREREREWNMAFLLCQIRRNWCLLRKFVSYYLTFNMCTSNLSSFTLE